MAPSAAPAATAAPGNGRAQIGCLRRRTTGGGIPQHMLKKFLILVLITTIHSALLAQTATPTPRETYYTCVMHPEVMQDHPGKCPKCGMELVPVKKEGKRRTSNIEHRTPNEETVHPMHHHHDHDAAEGHAMHEMK